MVVAPVIMVARNGQGKDKRRKEYLHILLVSGNMSVAGFSVGLLIRIGTVIDTVMAATASRPTATIPTICNAVEGPSAPEVTNLNEEKHFLQRT